MGVVNAFTGMAEHFLVSQPSELSKALSLAAGWVINVLIAEWAIRRLPAHRARTASVTTAPMLAQIATQARVLLAR